LEQILMTSGPLDQSGLTSAPRSAPELIPRIRNPVVESWNDEDGDVVVPKREPAGGRELASRPSAATALLASAAIAPNRMFLPLMLALAVFAAGAGVMEIVLTAMPAKPYLTSWRYTTVGSVATLLLMPLLAVTLTTGVLLLAERRLLARIVMVLFTLLLIGVIAVIPMFLLDAIQTRPTLASELRGGVFLLVLVKTSSLYIGAAIVLITSTVVLHRAIRKWSAGAATVAEWDR